VAPLQNGELRSDSLTIARRRAQIARPFNRGVHNMEKRQSIWLETWNQLQALRIVHLVRLGRFAEVEQIDVARMSAQLKYAAHALLAMAQTQGTDEEAALMLEMAWEEFIDPDGPVYEWASNLAPAFPLHAFANPTVLEKCWRAAEKTIADEAELRRLEARR
jgi:hypothetical protein